MRFGEIKKALFKTQNSVFQLQLLVTFFTNAHFKLETQYSNSLYKVLLLGMSSYSKIE